jgi:hypothetical protein
MDETTLRREAQALLRTLGPMSPEQLGRHLLADRPPGPGEEALGDPRWLQSVLVDDEVEGEEFSAYPLADGRLCDLDDLLEGLTLTHELSERERREQTLATDLDLAPLSLLSADGLTYPLTAGQEAIDDRSETFELTGPAGWLPDAPVVVARVVDGRIELTGREELPPVDETVVDRLDQTLTAVRAQHDAVDEIDLLIEARARYPRLLNTPHAPLGQLLAAAEVHVTNLGLRYEDELDEMWEDEAELDELITHLHEDHGFDDDEVEALLAVWTEVQRISSHVLLASLDRVRATEAGGPLELEALDRDQLAAMTLDALEAVDLDVVAEQLAFVLADIRTTAAVVEDVVGSEALAGAGLLSLMESSRPTLSGRTPRANDAWVRGRVLELVAEDQSEAEVQLRRALELDDGHVYAALDVANYLSDRGQAGAALGLLRRIDVPALSGFERLLATYAKPGPTSAGRNDPCPCGSGRKHKVCCQARNGWPLQDRLPWVWEKVNGFAASPRAASFAEPIEQATGLSGQPGSEDRDVAVANLTLFEGGALQELCDARGSLLPADELELLRGWAQVRARLYELVETGAGDRLTVLDLTSGERATFVDHSMAAADIAPGTAFLGWLVPEPDGPAPSIGAVKVEDAQREGLLDLLDEQPSAVELAIWYRGLQAPPRLRTTAGDPMVLTTLVYAVTDHDAAQAALADHLEDDGDQLTAHEEGDDGQRWMKGAVTVEDGTLRVTTNSAPRAAWFEALIAEVVPEAELIDAERLPAEDVLVGMGDGPDEDDPANDDGLLDLDALDPEARAGLEAELEAMMLRHEDAWLDTPLPILHGATPRQAVDDPTRRDELLRLLDEMERHAASWSSPGRPMDATRLRELLGI